METVICSDSLTRKCSPQDYGRSISVRWQTVELEQRGRVPSLNIYRSLFLTAFRDQIEDYFPEGSMTNFDILLPTNLPQKEYQILLYGLGYIQALAGKFGLDPASTVSQWTKALINIAKSDEFCRFQKEEGIYFWQHYLNSQTIPWDDNISKLIKLVLVLQLEVLMRNMFLDNISYFSDHKDPSYVCICGIGIPKIATSTASSTTASTTTALSLLLVLGWEVNAKFLVRAAKKHIVTAVDVLLWLNAAKFLLPSLSVAIHTRRQGALITGPAVLVVLLLLLIDITEATARPWKNLKLLPFRCNHFGAAVWAQPVRHWAVWSLAPAVSAPN
uniref:Uncharacterized protein n=1 Tax=Romanomermis culicivorax TaxID=13658 RepID=A0A915JWE0_ROMCU